MVTAACTSPVTFQSTHPARGATTDHRTGGGRTVYFNPRTPRGVRLMEIDGILVRLDISIHAPREGCDANKMGTSMQMIQFQSTHPARGATRLAIISPPQNNISIHAPREGCDRSLRAHFTSNTNFNPRTPRGVRQQTLPKSREFAWLNLLICTRGRRLSIQKQTRLCSIKLSFMLFGCEPAGEGVSSWTSHATKSKVRLEGRSA